LGKSKILGENPGNLGFVPCRRKFDLTWTWPDTDRGHVPQNWPDLNLNCTWPLPIQV